jgi:2-polyprenyl-6-methoxyphenol hydroxylase-like FAD-dependent oxidoreductase
MPSLQDPVIIIGAGVSGLTLAQACRKKNIPYRIYERDESVTSRGAGWGLTIHWALSTFKALLPDELVSRLSECYVNRGAVEAGEKGSFTFFDLSTGEPRWQVPAAERIRVSREKLRTLLLTGLDVEWSKDFQNIEIVDGAVKATFSDGTSRVGSMLVGCDGANSAVRRLLHPETHQNEQLPVRLLGATANYSESQISAIRNLDPFFLQGTDPNTDAYLWFSFLETPSDGREDGTYKCQVIVSWPYRENWLDRVDPTECPNTKTGQLFFMNYLSESWAEPFHSLLQNMPKDSEIRPIELADWLPQASTGFGGRVMLVGDAAHAMVMYRGEGANHSIVDVSKLLEQIKRLYERTETMEGNPFETAQKAYESEMIERTKVAVLASRQACLDAHEYARIDEKSPLVKRRMMRTDLEVDYDHNKKSLPRVKPLNGRNSPLPNSYLSLSTD